MEWGGCTKQVVRSNEVRVPDDCVRVLSHLLMCDVSVCWVHQDALGCDELQVTFRSLFTFLCVSWGLQLCQQGKGDRLVSEALDLLFERHMCCFVSCSDASASSLTTVACRRRYCASGSRRRPTPPTSPPSAGARLNTPLGNDFTTTHCSERDTA